MTLFSAMLHDEAVTVAQVRVPDGTNEITQAEAILEAAQIPAGKSALFTTDAAHAQQETAEAIGQKPGFGYVTTVKGNQPTCREQHSMRSSRCSARHRMTSWKSTAAGGLRNGPAGLPARTASISRTPARLHFVRREVPRWRSRECPSYVSRSSASRTPRICASEITREERGRPWLVQLSLQRVPGVACSPGAVARGGAGRRR